MSTTISWTEETWNPVRGCSRVSPGCVNCYAERMAARNLPEMKSPTTGDPFAIMTDSGPRWTGKVELIEKALTKPMHWRKPRRVFVNSMSDLFHESLPDEAIDRVFVLMTRCPQHTFQILTKRADRMRRYFERRQKAFRDVHKLGLSCTPVALPNVWLGVSIENQETATARIPELLATPAAVRFVSYEPALEGVDLTPFLNVWRGKKIERIEDIPSIRDCVALDWVIIGGESGPGARPFDLKWARGTIRDCQAAEVPVFMKQLGAYPQGSNKDLGKWRIHARTDPKGENWKYWPPDLRIRQYPEPSRGFA